MVTKHNIEIAIIVEIIEGHAAAVGLKLAHRLAARDTSDVIKIMRHKPP
jgi:hypothetical protein